MKFTITRTSTAYSTDDNGNKIPPHPAARLETFPNWDRRTFKTPADYDFRFGLGSWFSEGTDHGTWSEGICRLLCPQEHWTIEIPDPLFFIQTVGPSILTPPSDPREGGTGLWHLEIQDE